MHETLYSVLYCVLHSYPRYYQMMIQEEYMINTVKKDYRSTVHAATLMFSPGTYYIAYSNSLY